MTTHGRGSHVFSPFLTGATGARPVTPHLERYPTDVSAAAVAGGDPALSSGWLVVDGKRSRSRAARRKQH